MGVRSIAGSGARCVFLEKDGRPMLRLPTDLRIQPETARMGKTQRFNSLPFEQRIRKALRNLLLRKALSGVGEGT
jgi:hypothetical protein